MPKVNHEIRRFDSWGELLDLVESPLPQDIDKARLGGLREKRKGFNATNNIDEAVALARFGWVDGPRRQIADATQAVKETIAPTLVDAFQTYFDVSGGEVDVDRFLQGEPENMIEMLPVKASKHGRVITIIVAGTVACGEDEAEYTKRGAAVVGLVECLELLQHNTEVFIEYTINAGYGSKGGKYTILVKVKAANEKFDIDKLSFAVAHPDSLRRIVFHAQDHEPKAIRTAFGFEGGGYGMGPYTPVMGDEVGAAVIMNNLSYGETAEDWIRKNLSEFGLLDA